MHLQASWFAEVATSLSLNLRLLSSAEMPKEIRKREDLQSREIHILSVGQESPKPLEALNLRLLPDGNCLILKWFLPLHNPKSVDWP